MAQDNLAARAPDPPGPIVVTANRGGILPDNLVCGAPPRFASPLKHGCSGNHAAILLIAHLLNAPLEGYHLPEHPAQQLLAERIRELSGAVDLPVAIDGCGIPTFGL